MQQNVFEINVFYTLSIMIAAVVRYHQTPPILEIMFLAKLLAIQNLTNSTILFSIYFDSEFNKIPTRGTTICRLGNSIVLIARGYSISLRRDAFSIYYEVSKYCYESHGYIDISHLFGPTIRADNAKGLGLAVGAFSGLLLLLFIFYFFASVRSKLWAWWLRLRRLPPGLVQRVWHRTLYARTIIRKHFYKAVAFIIMWIYSWLIISYAIRLDQIKRLAGQERDNEWGYGQTTAVLLLLPAGKAALKSGYGKPTDLILPSVPSNALQKFGPRRKPKQQHLLKLRIAKRCTMCIWDHLDLYNKQILRFLPPRHIKKSRHKQCQTRNPQILRITMEKHLHQQAHKLALVPRDLTAIDRR